MTIKQKKIENIDKKLDELGYNKNEESSSFILYEYMDAKEYRTFILIRKTTNSISGYTINSFYKTSESGLVSAEELDCSIAKLVIKRAELTFDHKEKRK